MTTKVTLCCGQLFVRKGTKPVIFITATQGDTHNGHPGIPGLIDQTIGITTAKQFAKEDEDISLLEYVLLRYFTKWVQFGHMDLLVIRFKM